MSSKNQSSGPLASALCTSIVILAMLSAVRIAAARQVQLDGRTFTLPDGFTIERVAGPPLVNRPIQADFDEQGRLYVADSSGSSAKVQEQLRDKPHRIVRLTDSHRNGVYDQSVVFADHMMFPEGSMWYAGSLYVAAPPAIWKLTDASGAGIATDRQQWFDGKTLTGCANDLHGPYLGPDGWICWCKGAFAEQTYARPGKKPFVTRAAHIFRARPDGSGIEPVMTGGMDNPVHVVFTPDGERLFTTTFLQNPANGQRDGIIHAIYGGIYGKVHDVIDDHPHTSPGVMPVLVQLGPAAACGLLCYDCDLLGPEYRDNLFATEFNLHKVTRHVLRHEGATYAATSEDFLVCDSLDFHPTDVIEDADGSLLVIDTGGWYKLCCPTSQIGKPDVLGAIYRVRREGMPRVDDPRELKLDLKGMTPGQVVKLLGDQRPAVRKRAIQAVTDRGIESYSAIEQTLRSSDSIEARRNAVWAATRIDDPKARALARLALHDANESVRQAAAHSASVWRDRDALPDLLQLLSTDSAFNRRVAAEALGRLGDPRAIAPLFEQIARPNDRVLDHSLTFALVEIDDAKGTALGLASANPRVRRSALIALDQMEGASTGELDARAVVSEMNTSDAALRDTAAWVAARHPEWGDALASALKRQLNAFDRSPDEQMQLQHQLAKLSHSPAIQKLLADELHDPSTTTSSRRLALRGMADANLNEAPAAWIDGISKLLTSSDQDLLSDSIATLSKLRLPKGARSGISTQLLSIASRTDLPAQLRLEAVEAMPRMPSSTSAELFAFLRDQVNPSKPAIQQLLAAQAIARAKLTTEQLSALCESLTSVGPLEIQPVLDAFQQTTDPAIGRKLLDSLNHARSLSSLRADVLRARLDTFGDDVRTSAQPLLAKLNPTGAQQKARLDHLQATLPPGDARRGQLIFNSPRAACASCHAIGYVGGHVGPDLTRVGSVRAERDLLESIVYPSASFVQSFEPVAVLTTSGQQHYGVVRRNDATEVMLVTGPNQEVHVPRGEVKDMKPGKVSLMPEGFADQLTPQELADLIAFLRGCR